MVESKHKDSPKKRRSRSSSTSSSGSSSSTSSSGSASSSSSSSSESKSPTPKKSRSTATARDERPARRSPRRSRSPRRVVQPKTEKTTVSSRRSPSPTARRRQASPARRRSRSPRRSPPPRRERVASPPRERRERTPEPQSRRLCVRNLSRNVTKAHLEEIFALFGVIKTCELPMDRVHTHLPRGYGYVEYEKAEDAEKAMKHMDGGQIDGLELKCEMTLPYRAGRANSPVMAGMKRDRSRSPRRVGGRAASPPRRMRRSRSPPPARGTGANTIPLGNSGGTGRYRSPPRR